MKPHIYKNRLLKLADFLDTVPDERFNFRRWVSSNWDGKTPLHLCNTTACAFGWATAVPLFRKLGLRLGIIRDGAAVVYLVQEGLPGPYDGTDAAQSAAHEVFGLDHKEFDFLFFPWEETGDSMYGRNAPHYDASAVQLAEHIRFFVKNKYG